MQSDALASPAIGTASNDLIEPCDRGPRAAKPGGVDVPPAIALALSGGGFRATLSGLGVVRFLADAGLLHRLRYSSSVSGGSVANALLARSYPQLKASGFTRAAIDEEVLQPLLRRITSRSLKRALLRRSWRLLGPRTRTDLLAEVLDDWWLRGLRLSDLAPDSRWIFNAANLTTGVRFGFERDVAGDWVVGLGRTADSGLRVAQAVAASAAVPGAFAPVVLERPELPCADGRRPRLLDGGVYDNMGLEPLDDLREACVVALNSGGVLRVGRAGLVPIVRDLQRSNALLYRQSTALRRRHMVDRFRAWERARDAGEAPPDFARQGVLFSLATKMDPPAEWLEGRPEHADRREELALVRTSFDSFPIELCERLIYRGWWLAGASLAAYHRRLLPAQLPTWSSL